MFVAKGNPRGFTHTGIISFTVIARRGAIDESELRICLSIKRGATLQ